MLRDYIAESVGSFVFFSIFFTQKNPIYIAVGLLIGILIASIASQSHLNPAISTMAYVSGDMSGEVAVGYIVSQLIGAFAAYEFSKLIGSREEINHSNKVEPAQEIINMIKNNQ